MPIKYFYINRKKASGSDGECTVDEHIYWIFAKIKKSRIRNKISSVMVRNNDGGRE